MAYDPSGVGVSGSIFGYPYTEDESELLLLPVPWDVTVSYGGGASQGPQSILEASPQLDLSMHHVSKPWLYSCAMLPSDAALIDLNEQLRPQALAVIEALEEGKKPQQLALDNVNLGCEQMVNRVYELSKYWLDKGVSIGLVGGDHSTPLGLLRALSERGSFGILQIDAHMDLRSAYEGFKYSHASIMHHAIALEGISSLSQVGIRDYCEEEEVFRSHSEKPIYTYFDDQVKEGMLVGDSWSDWVQSIVTHLPENVYISFDIDGLTPFLCPNTGTPVPGGLSFEEAIYLIKKVVSSGRKIIGFDLSEVSPGAGDWDANVGARILYRLVTMTGVSQGKIKSFL